MHGLLKKEKKRALYIDVLLLRVIVLNETLNSKHSSKQNKCFKVFL